jgi:hypothetical protein
MGSPLRPEKEHNWASRKAFAKGWQEEILCCPSQQWDLACVSRHLALWEGSKELGQKSDALPTELARQGPTVGSDTLYCPVTFLGNYGMKSWKKTPSEPKDQRTQVRSLRVQCLPLNVRINIGTACFSVNNSKESCCLNTLVRRPLTCQWNYSKIILPINKNPLHYN